MPHSPERRTDTELADELSRSATTAYANLVVLEQHGARLRNGLAQIRSVLRNEVDSPITRQIAQVFAEYQLDDAADTAPLIDACTQAIRSTRDGLERLAEIHPPFAMGRRVNGRSRRPHHRARVLVVDDEKQICSTYIRILTPFHEVVAVDAGDKARTLLERDSAFDVVICDLMMPEVDGPTLYRCIRDRNPWLAARFVFCSGGTVTASTQNFAESVSNTFIEKPLSCEDLLDVIERQVATQPAMPLCESRSPGL